MITAMNYVTILIAAVVMFAAWRLLVAYVRHDSFHSGTSAASPPQGWYTAIRSVQFPALDARRSRGAGYLPC
jgi:hypothetical protein